MAKIAPIGRREYEVARDIRDKLLEVIDENRERMGIETLQRLDGMAADLGRAMADYEARGWFGRWLPPPASPGEVALRTVLEAFVEEARQRAGVLLRRP